MRINGESPESPLFGRRPVRPGSASGSRRAASTSSSSSSAATTSSHPTSELMAKLQGIPEVRLEILEDILQRLNRGELLTREAAEATAVAILCDRQSFLNP